MPDLVLFFSHKHCHEGQRVTMFTSIALCCLSLFALNAHAQNNNVFKITAPKAGDTVTVSKYTTDDVAVPIEWTVPDAIASRPVLITLVQGNDLSSLETISQLEGASVCFRQPTQRHDPARELIC